MVQISQNLKYQRSIPTIISLESRSSVEVDISELITEGTSDIFPQIEERGLLFFQFRKKKVVITAGAYVGLVPVTPRLSVNIKPKLPVANIGRILDLSRRSLELFSSARRQYQDEPLESNSVLEFLLANLVHGLRGLEPLGIQKKYLPVLVEGAPRGKINVPETIRRFSARGRPQLVSCWQYTQTTDIPVNRVMKAALLKALPAAEAASVGSGRLRGDANQALNAMPSKIGQLKPSDISYCEGLATLRDLPANFSHYYAPLEAALMILRERGISLSHIAGETSLDAFIVNFEVIFEDYLREVLCAEKDRPVTVESGNDRAKKSLFDDRKDPPAQPDIVITHQDGRKLIAEVKYKEKVDRSDINQALTYALSYRTGDAVLLHLAKATHQAGLRHLGKVNGIRLSAYGVNLGSADLAQEEKRFAAAIYNLF